MKRFLLTKIQFFLIAFISFNFYYVYAEEGPLSYVSDEFRNSKQKLIAPSVASTFISELCYIEILQEKYQLIIKWNKNCFPYSSYVLISFHEYFKSITTENDGYFSIPNFNISFLKYIHICIKGSIDLQSLCKIVEISDSEKPTGLVTNIHSSYNIGENVRFVITVRDNKNLSKIQFTVKNNSNSLCYDRKWASSGTYVTKSSYFTTDNWKPDRYTYTLLITDSSDNKQNYSGSFNLIDSIKPTGFIHNLLYNSSYEIGDIIHCSIRGHDETSLREIIFNVKNSSNYIKYLEKWRISSSNFYKDISFSTQSWDEGQYTCTLTIIDSNGNTSIYNDSFTMVSIKRQQSYSLIDALKLLRFLSGIDINNISDITEEKTIKISSVIYILQMITNDSKKE